jgi:3-dehydroquinate dehydratase type I
MPLTELVDVEIVNAPLLLKAKQLRNGNMPLIIGSYHNFDCTPEDAMLNEIMLKGRTLGADIIKIATMAQSREDALRLLLFTHRHRSDGIITMAMGDNGIPTRVIGPLFGSIITYASVATSSAPGQISASELSGIFQSLKLR